MQMSLHATFIQPPPFANLTGLAWLGSASVWAAQTVFYSAFQGIPYFARLPIVRFFVAVIAVAILVGHLHTRKPQFTKAERCYLVVAALPAGILLALSGLELSVVEQRHWTFALGGEIVLVALLVGGVTPASVVRAWRPQVSEALWRSVP
jgi:hypothetical protein